MKTLRNMSVIGIILASLAFICLVSFDNPYEYISAIGWGMYAALYLLAFAIVGTVQASKHKK